VFAACYSEETEGAKALAKEFNGNRMHVVGMDVTSEESVNKALETVKNKLPDGTGLWAVITNAGLSTFGQVEWVPMDVYQKTMEINLFGTIRTIKASLPLIRRGKGRVITVASMMGRFGAPARSPYCCTKWGVEGLTECLRLEMKRWGVSVTCIEPGNFIAGTAIYAGDAVKRQADHMWNNMSEVAKEDYTKEYFDAFIEKMNYYASNGDTNIEPVVNTLADAVGHTYPQTRYQIFSLDEKIKAFVATHLPSIVFDYFYNKM
jgi:3-hydroxybutyrate dehydrogenase